MVAMAPKPVLQSTDLDQGATMDVFMVSKLITQGVGPRHVRYQHGPPVTKEEQHSLLRSCL